jgi:hypothetical protein
MNPDQFRWRWAPTVAVVMCGVGWLLFALAGSLGPDLEVFTLAPGALLMLLATVPAVLGVVKLWRPRSWWTAYAAVALVISFACASFPVLVVWAFSNCPRGVC